MEFEEISVAQMPEDMKFSTEDIDLAMTLTKWVDAKDKDAPHNIGLTLLGVITGYLKGRKDGKHSRFYNKYEFCKDINCHLLEDKCLVKQIDTEMFDHGCPHSAKTFHKWLKENGFFILKPKSTK